MILSWRWKNTCNTLTVASYLACMLQIFLLTSFPFSDRYIKVIYRIYWITCKCIYKWLVLNIASKLGSLRHQNYYHCEIGHWNWLLTFSLHPCHSKKNRRRKQEEEMHSRSLSSKIPFVLGPLWLPSLLFTYREAKDRLYQCFHHHIVLAKHTEPGSSEPSPLKPWAQTKTFQIVSSGILW